MPWLAFLDSNLYYLKNCHEMEAVTMINILIEANQNCIKTFDTPCWEVHHCVQFLSPHNIPEGEAFELYDKCVWQPPQ